MLLILVIVGLISIFFKAFVYVWSVFVCVFVSTLTSIFLLHCLFYQIDDVIFCDLLLFLRDDAMVTKGVIPFGVCVRVLWETVF